MGRNRRDRRRLLPLLAAVWLLGAGPAGPLDTGWTVGRAVPIAVRGGRGRLRVPTPTSADRVMLVISVLGRGQGPYRGWLRVRPCDGSPPAPAGEPHPAARPDAPAPIPTEPIEVRSVPPSAKVFHVLGPGGDVAKATSYDPVPSTLRALGRRVQVYVDDADLGRVVPSTLRDLVQTFDDRVYPVSAREVGTAADVDGDGRFTLLLTSRLATLGGGRLAAEGCVRGADLDPEVAPPLGNRCDMMYLNALTTDLPHLRTVVAHEYSHAVMFTRKTLADPPVEEEGWIDEGVAHLAEDRHGFSRSNIEGRVAAFLGATGRYRLVVEDYHAADLYRSPGHRGSTYSFLRWCADRRGPGFVRVLVGSRLRGVSNVEAAMGEHFPELYRGWTASLTCAPGLRPIHVLPGGLPEPWSLVGTSSAYVLIESSTSGHLDIEVEGSSSAELQLTAIRLGPTMKTAPPAGPGG